MITYHSVLEIVMSNKSLSASELLFLHNGRGSQDATFAEVESQLGLGYLPSRRQVGNQVYMLCNLLVHALGRELQMQAAPPRTMKHTATRACLWAVERIDTIRKRLIHRAARITPPNGHLVLTFARCDEAEGDVRHLLQVLPQA